MSKVNKGAFGRSRLARQPQSSSPEIPYELKADIARAVRDIEITIAGAEGGNCFWRAMTGFFVLRYLGFNAKPAMGGMIYRAGPDPLRDVVAFCGPGNAGCVMDNRFLGHYWVVAGGEFVDFSVGDWRQAYEEQALSEREWSLRNTGKWLGPIQWTAPELPKFFWDKQTSFDPSRQANTPALGKAWYTGFHGDNGTQARFESLMQDAVPVLKTCSAALMNACRILNLKDRLHRIGFNPQH